MAAEKADTVTRVQLPEAGDGVELYLTVADFRRLFNKFGKEYVGIVDSGLSAADFDIMDEFLSIAAKRKGKPFPTKIDALDLRLEVLRDKLRDAYTYSLAGVSYQDYLVKMAKDTRLLTEKLTGEAEPETPFLGAGSDNSTTERTEPDSSQKNLIL